MSRERCAVTSQPYQSIRCGEPAPRLVCTGEDDGGDAYMITGVWSPLHVYAWVMRDIAAKQQAPETQYTLDARAARLRRDFGYARIRRRAFRILGETTLSCSKNAREHSTKYSLPSEVIIEFIALACSVDAIHTRRAEAGRIRLERITLRMSNSSAHLPAATSTRRLTRLRRTRGQSEAGHLRIVGDMRVITPDEQKRA